MNINGYIATLSFLLASLGVCAGQELFASSSGSFASEQLGCDWSLGEIFIDTYVGSNQSNFSLSGGFNQGSLVVAGINEEDGCNILLVPNPTRRKLTIFKEGDIDLNSYAVYNSLGACITKETLQDSLTIDLGGIADGQYIIIVIDSQGKSRSFKIYKITQ